jgi:thioredoxin-like negative regulator of GroEL
MIGGPARLLAVLAFAAAVHSAAAGDRFVPQDPAFVVANIRQVMPDESLRKLVAGWRSDQVAEAPATALAESLLQHARELREPSYVGRAEAVLAPVVSGGNAGPTSRRLYAETLQYRHDFHAAESILDDLLREAPRDFAARTLRASIRLVRGDFSGARGDCAQLVARGDADSAVGIACLAEAYAGSGQFEQAQALLRAFALNADPSRAAIDAYVLTIRAELRERAHDLVGAIADYHAALALLPRDDAIRAALADALAAGGSVLEARAVLDVERPSLALLVRRAAVTEGSQRDELRTRAADWLALEAARGDAIHNREAAMLALSAGDARRALAAAQANFAVQKELPDVRVLARAAVAAGDAAAQQRLRDWLHTTGFADAVSENILSGVARG